MTLKSFIDRLFTKHLLATNCVGICGCLALGDFLEQKVAAKARGHDGSTDTKRIGRMAASGLPVGVVETVWYGWLDRRFPGAAFTAIKKKLVLDMFVGGPLINMVWLPTIELLEGKSVRDAVVHSLYKLPYVLAGEVVFYIPAQFVNFRFVAPRFRVMYVGVLTTVWVVFLSFVQHDLHATTAQRESGD